jgi:hypothetical protein
MIKVITRFFVVIAFLIGCLGPSFSNEQASLSLDFMVTDGDFSLYVKTLEERTKPAIELFRNSAANLNLDSIRSVFYPFGGPDIIYPMLLFKGAENFVLVGLEYPGTYGYINSKNIDIDNAKRDLSTLIEKSFFITNKMSKTFSKAVGNSGAILLQLKIMGISDVNIEFIKDKKGVCYEFYYDGKKRKVYYFKANLDDYHFPDYIKELIVSMQGPKATMFKAASYLPHHSGFSKLQEFCPEFSDIILQDDSGLPYHHLNAFDVYLWGPYIKPYGVEFAAFWQKELISLNTDKTIGFCFGYGCGKQPAVLMVASKKGGAEQDVKQ